MALRALKQLLRVGGDGHKALEDLFRAEVFRVLADDNQHEVRRGAHAGQGFAAGNFAAGFAGEAPEAVLFRHGAGVVLHLGGLSGKAFGVLALQIGEDEDGKGGFKGGIAFFADHEHIFPIVAAVKARLIFAGPALRQHGAETFKARGRGDMFLLRLLFGVFAGFVGSRGRHGKAEEQSKTEKRKTFHDDSFVAVRQSVRVSPRRRTLASPGRKPVFRRNVAIHAKSMNMVLFNAGAMHQLSECLMLVCKKTIKNCTCVSDACKK